MSTPSPTSSNRPTSYSTWFVLLLLGASVFVMVASFRGGITSFDESFLGRKFLITNFNHLRYSLGDHVFPQVVIGKQGWMQFTGDGNLDDYQNAYLFEDKLVSVQQKLTTLKQELAQRNITLIVVIVPNKETIYPETVPSDLQKLGKTSRFDIFLKMMKKTDPGLVVDLRPALKQAREQYQIYYKTDTHWNSLGAYFAYREIMKAASQTYPELQPYELSRFKVKELGADTRDLARVTGMYFIKESTPQLEPKFSTEAYFKRFTPTSSFSMSWGVGAQQQTLLMYHDSFGIALLPFLQNHFKQALFIQNSLEPGVTSMSWIDRVQPNLVIIEISERGLPNLDFFLSNP